MGRKETLASFKQVLVRRRDALRSALAGDLSLLKELRQQTSGDVLDAALDTAQDELSSQLAEVESRELANIELALERIRSDEYGVCDGCGEGISYTVTLSGRPSLENDLFEPLSTTITSKSPRSIFF